MNRGFTLVETAIYLALLSFLILTTITTADRIFQSTNGSADQILVNSEIGFVMEKIGSFLNGKTSSDIDVSDPTKLRIMESGQIVTCIFESNQKIFVGHESCDKSTGHPITSAEVYVDELSFKKTSSLLETQIDLSDEKHYSVNYLHEQTK